MRLIKLKIFNLILILFIFPTYSHACENITFSNSEIYIFSKKNKEKFKFDVQIADTKPKRKKGFQCQKNIKINEGMFFVWNLEDKRYFWMKNTEFSLDIIFINKYLKIVDIFFNAKPYDLMTITSVKKAKYVLELHAGVFKSLNLEIGDQLIFKKNKKIVSN